MDKKSIIYSIIIFGLIYLYVNDYLPIKYHRSFREVLGQAHKKYDAGNYYGAIRLLRRASRLNPDNLGAIYHDIGNNYIILKKYKRAIKPLTKSIEIEPNNGSSYYLRGLAYYHLDKTEEARADLNNSIRFYQKPYTYILLTNIESVNKNYDKALEYANKYESLTSKDNLDLAITKMDLIANTKGTDAAIAYAKKIEPRIKSEPEYNYKLEDLYYAWGNLLAGQHKDAEAIEKYKQTIKLNPKHEYAYSEICDSYAELNDGENAIKYCLKGNKVFPHAIGFVHTCKAYYVARQYEEGLRYCNLLINNHYDIPFAYYYRAAIYKELNQTEDAKKDLIKARETLMDWEEEKSLTQSNFTMKKGDESILKMIDELSKSL